MRESSVLTIDIRSFWHAGTGRGSGSHLDALVERDINGLPFVSGKMLKGLLRDAVNRAATWQVLSVQKDKPDALDAGQIVEILFGSPGFGADNAPRDATLAGLLKISNAQMPEVLRDWLGGGTPEHLHLRNKLFRSIYSTAINSDSGVAKKGSLRGQEVTVPMQLEARISLLPMPAGEHSEAHILVAEYWHSIVQQALPLVRAVGSNRTRGLGRAHLTLGNKGVQA